MPTDQIKIELYLPASEYEKLGTFIMDTVEKAFTEKARAIQKEKIKLTRTEAAKRLRISLPTLDKLRADGVLKSQQVGKRILICEAEIENYLNRGK